MKRWIATYKLIAAYLCGSYNSATWQLVMKTLNNKLRFGRALGTHTYVPVVGGNSWCRLIGWSPAPTTFLWRRAIIRALTSRGAAGPFCAPSWGQSTNVLPADCQPGRELHGSLHLWWSTKTILREWFQTEMSNKAGRPILHFSEPFKTRGHRRCLRKIQF